MCFDSMGYFFLGLSIGLWLLVFCIQQWESRMGKIPGRRKWNRNAPQESFLYLQDWNTGSWGDIFGLSLLAFAFGNSSYFSGRKSDYIAFLIAVVFTAFLHKIWKKSNPNSGYPDKGEISWSGVAHLIYTLFHSFIVASLLLSFNAWGDEVVVPLVIGGCIYLSACLVDWYQGKLSTCKHENYMRWIFIMNVWFVFLIIFFLIHYKKSQIGVIQ